MLRTFLPLALGLSLSAVALAQARPPIPSVVLDHMNDLDRRCVAAGGRAGQGRFVVAQDFTGDGRLDYLLSVGDYDCVGRPGLFRKGGVARVDLFVVDARNAARRVYSDQLIGYRVLAGQPARVQIARQGAACGAGSTARTQCAAQLAWNGHGVGEAIAVSDAKAPSASAAPGSPATSRPQDSQRWPSVPCSQPISCAGAHKCTASARPTGTRGLAPTTPHARSPGSPRRSAKPQPVPPRRACRPARTPQRTPPPFPIRLHKNGAAGPPDATP